MTADKLLIFPNEIHMMFYIVTYQDEFLKIHVLTQLKCKGVPLYYYYYYYYVILKWLGLTHFCFANNFTYRHVYFK